MKDTSTPINHSSPTVQLQEILHLNFSDETGIGVPETAPPTPNSQCGRYLLVQRPSVSASFLQMEETSNGKLEETREVESQAEAKEVYIQDVGDSKPVDESERDMDVADNSEPANERGIKVEDSSVPADKSVDGKDDSGSESSSSDEEAEPAEKSPHQVLEEKEVLAYVIDSAVDQPPVDLDETGESSPPATDLPSKEINDSKTLPPFEESNEIPPAVKDLASEASSDHNNEASEVVTEAFSKGNEGTESQTREENPGENSNKAISEGGGAELDNPETPESTVNQSTVSATGRPMQPTSWRSCCGLFEVVRRSGR